MPGQGLGVAIVVNSGEDPGFSLVDALARDFYARALGREGDAPDLTELASKRRRPPADEVRGFDVPGPANDPIRAEGGLSQAPATYVGRYRSPEFGEIAVEISEDRLHLRYGALDIACTTFRGEDTLMAFVLPRQLLVPGRFVVKEARVVALELDLPGTPEGVARLERTP